MPYTRLDYRRLANILANARHILDPEEVRAYIGEHIADFLKEGDKSFRRDVFLEHAAIEPEDTDSKERTTT